MKKMRIQTRDLKTCQSFFKKNFSFPKKRAHKGENGKLLIIGGSKLFHAACLWSAEVASHFVDIVHFCSTQENEEIFLSLKKIFRNGMVIAKKDLNNYIKEDDVILVGTGMVREEKNKIGNLNHEIRNFSDLEKVDNEGVYTYFLTKYLIENHQEKKFVFDAGAVQMMENQWLKSLKIPAIITPHLKEFERLFGINLERSSLEEKEETIFQTARKFKTTILFKNVDDIISDGDSLLTVIGGNQGLTKGGTGDVLAGLAASFYINHSSFYSSCFASMVLKITADKLFSQSGYWYNVSNIIRSLPVVLKDLVL